MAAAEGRDFVLKLDRRDRPVLSAACGANVNGTSRNRSGVELVGDSRPVHCDYSAQAYHQQ
jgi:hypothetical protein